MKWLWLSLFVISPAMLYGAGLVFVAVYRRRCPRCQRHGLRMVGGYKWYGGPAGGGGAVTFYLCEKCGTHLKQGEGDWTEPTDNEWKQHATYLLKSERSA